MNRLLLIIFLIHQKIKELKAAPDAKEDRQQRVSLLTKARDQKIADILKPEQKKKFRELMKNDGKKRRKKQPDSV